MTIDPTQALVVALDDAVQRLNARGLDDVLRDAGIGAIPRTESPVWSDVPRMELGAGHRSLVELAQRSIGTPGTRIRDGRIEVEHNTRLKPWTARGRLSKPGLLEEIYRTEPVVFKSVNEISALVCNASYEPSLPDSLPARARDIVQAQHEGIRRAMLRDDFLVNAASFIKYGWAFFEVLWDNPSSPTPFGLEFREQSTVERWLFDDRRYRWLATEFRTGGDVSETYIIPNGRSYRSARSLLVNLFPQGNNLEGVSPIRVIVGLRKLKELILQSFGISYQKYAVPIATIVYELTDASAAVIAQMGAAQHKGEAQDLIDRLQAMRSRLGAVLPIPAGYRLEYQNPTSDMPDPKPILDYLDMMMALVFANEGALLGSQSFGSYAMARTSDEKFMRSAPLYAGRIASSLTNLLHLGMELNGIDLATLPELPLYTFRFNGTQDASRFLGDLIQVMGANPARWPDEVKRAAAARLGLPADVFDQPMGTLDAAIRSEEE